MKLIYLEWADAMSINKWKTEEEAKYWAKGSSWINSACGWIIEETKKYILIGCESSYHSKYLKEEIEAVQFNNLYKIPKTWIFKRVDLTKYIV